MQINAVQHATREQLQNELLSLIRSRAKPQEAAAGAAPAVRPDEPAAEPVGPVQTHAAVREINHALKVLSTSLHFEIDQDSRETVVKVVDRDSGEVLRQIPSEATLQIARSLDRMAGHLINQHA